MKKIKYKDQNNKNYAIRIIVLLVLIFIFFLFNLILSNYGKAEKINTDNIDSIKDVIEFYESKYISETSSTEEGFNTDAYVEFKYPLYSENKSSNEEYFTKIINGCAQVIYYKSYRLIDSKNNINIQVICENRKIQKIIINGIEDYFIYMNSQYSMENYVEIVPIDIIAESPILQECINNRWDPNSINFGSRDSIFEGYYIYFDEGIRVRSISNKIYNIIFEKNYNANVLSGIFPGMDFDSIKQILGKPSFDDSNLGLIGYKGKEFYVFFYKDQISIYRNTEEDTEEFFKLADKFIDEEVDLLEFMNQLTYLWPDYSEYNYNYNYVFISYPLKGIEIKINYDDINGILVYNNIKAGLPKIETYLENTYFVARLQLDLVFDSERRRINSEEKLLDNCLEFKESLSEEDLKIIGESLKYDIYPLKDTNGYIFSMRFISKNGDMPNRELNDGISSYTWLGDYFIYSKKSKGIYSYDINTGYVSRLITGTENYNIKGIENGILKYDDKGIGIQY